MREADVSEMAQGVENLVRQHEVVAEEYSRDLENALRRSDNALDVIYDVFKEALDQAEGEGSPYTSAPYEEVPRSLTNAVGEVYPLLDRDQKDRAVGEILEFLDGKNYVYINGAAGPGYTTGIDDPLLLSDISVVRPLYWPGLEEGENLIRDFTNSEEAYLSDSESYDCIKDEVLDREGRINDEVDSKFLVSYTLLREDYSDFAADFVDRLDSKFLERTMRGIIALRFGLFAHESIDDRGELSESEYQRGKSRLEELLPEKLHEKIDPLKQEDFWIEPEKF